MSYNVSYWQGYRMMSDYDQAVSLAYLETTVVRMCRERGITALATRLPDGAPLEVDAKGVRDLSGQTYYRR